MSPEKKQLKHYVELLVALSMDADALLQVDKDIDVIADLIHNNSAIRRFIANTYIKPAGKIKALEEILTGKTHPILVRFILILQEHDHLSALNQIAVLFKKIVSKTTNRIDGKLTSARPISKEQITLIEKEVSAIMGNEIHLKTSVDPDMLAGVFIKVGDFVLDGTLDNQLESIRKKLLN